MSKFIKIFLYTVILFGVIQNVYAKDVQYIMESFEKCSTQNQCADVLNSVKNIRESAEADIMKLDNIIPKKPYVQTIVNADGEKEEKKFKLPKEVLEMPEGKIYKQESRYLSNIDPQKGEKGVNSTYPGLRGANQLIVYTPEFGLRTGTNEFGAEAIVVKNTVVKLSGADSLIPREGFVISGHGKSKTWIHDNITLGSKVYINPETFKIIVSITPETYIFEAKEKIKETENIIKYYQNTDACYDNRKALNYINKANDNIKKAEKHPEKAEHFLNTAKENVNIALSHSIPYREDEFKGIWIRPTEHSEREIERSAEALEEAGINNIFLETFYHGTTIYPSKVLEKYGITAQRGEFNTFDPLKVWIEECHKRNIKVHIWFETFYVGNKPPRSSRTNIFAIHPEWANTTKALAESDEIAHSVSEHNGYFLDPANPEVQQFLQELLQEIIEEYHPDGINLDYIRYPQSAYNKTDSSSGTEWGYTKSAREEFKTLYGKDPLEIKVADPIREKWFEYRQQKVTDFVEFARKLTRKNETMLTTVIFTDREQSLKNKMQDWKTWSRRNLTDGFTPLFLTTDKRMVGSLIREIKSQMNPHTKLYSGIFVMFMNAPTDELLLQIQESRKMHSDGIIFFDYAHFQKNYREALGIRAFNKKKY